MIAICGLDEGRVENSNGYPVRLSSVRSRKTYFEKEKYDHFVSSCRQESVISSKSVLENSSCEGKIFQSPKVKSYAYFPPNTKWSASWITIHTHQLI